MSPFGVALGTCLIIGALYILVRRNEAARILHAHYSNMNAGARKAYRGRLAFLAWGIVPSESQARVLACVFAIATIGLGTAFILGWGD